MLLTINNIYFILQLSFVIWLPLVQYYLRSLIDAFPVETPVFRGESYTANELFFIADTETAHSWLVSSLWAQTTRNAVCQVALSTSLSTLGTIQL